MQRMSGLDAAFLYVETPTMPMHVGLVCILDPITSTEPYDYARIHALLENEVRGQESFRKRPVEVPFGLSHPLWLDDPSFDAIHHIRRVACPAPGGQSELCDLVGRILSVPLDRSRPLWEVWVIEGLEHGRFALVPKVHHAIADGMGGAHLLQTMFTTTPDGVPRAGSSNSATLSSLPPPPVPSELDLLRDALASKLDASRDLVHMFKRTTAALSDFYERRTHEDHLGGATVFDSPRAPWNAPITSERAVAFARISQDEVRTIRKRFDTTANEVVLAICAGALRGYLEAHGELHDQPLVAACPLAMRSRTRGGNRISAMLTSLATHLDDPVARLAAIRASTRGAKAEHDQLGGDMLASWAELAFPGVFRTAAKLYSKYRVAAKHPPLYSLAISNVPGPRKPLYFAGARLLAAYPLGPIVEGAGLNVTVLTYGQHIDFGLVAARSLLPDLSDIARRLRDATAELLQIAQRAETERAEPEPDLPHNV
jgi:diacylglycerol O-acyltransferase / wax synthase